MDDAHSSRPPSATASIPAGARADAITGVSGVRPLDGFTVGVTAARRADELGALLRRRGAEVRHAPALRIVPLSDDQRLLAATRQLAVVLRLVVTTNGSAGNASLRRRISGAAAIVSPAETV
jgi:hypothetical protein